MLMPEDLERLIPVIAGNCGVLVFATSTCGKTTAVARLREAGYKATENPIDCILSYQDFLITRDASIVDQWPNGSIKAFARPKDDTVALRRLRGDPRAESCNLVTPTRQDISIRLLNRDEYLVDVLL